MPTPSKTNAILVGARDIPVEVKTRIANLRALLKQKYGSKQVNLARALLRQPDYVSRLLSGAKFLSGDMAREFERLLELPTYYLDAQHDECGLADELFNEAFDPKTRRDPRSAAYKAGVRAVLEFRVNGVKIIHPYDPGTAESDAFSAGTNEGHSIWRQHIDREANEPDIPGSYQRKPGG